MEQTVTTVSDVVTALGTALGTVATSALSAISTIVPIAAPVLGGVLVIGIGIKAFKKLAGK